MALQLAALRFALRYLIVVIGGANQQIAAQLRQLDILLNLLAVERLIGTLLLLKERTLIIQLILGNQPFRQVMLVVFKLSSFFHAISGTEVKFFRFFIRYLIAVNLFSQVLQHRVFVFQLADDRIRLPICLLISPAAIWLTLPEAVLLETSMI